MVFLLTGVIRESHRAVLRNQYPHENRPDDAGPIPTDEFAPCTHHEYVSPGTIEAVNVVEG